jgi:AmmeMemoRadiSam system protein A
METKTKRFVVEFARKVVENFVKTGEVLEIPKDYPEELDAKRGVFCTLFKKERGKESLRGCIGLPFPRDSVINNLREAAVGACQDPRFPPLEEKELKNLVIEVSILSEPVKIKAKKEKCLGEIECKKDGLIITRGARSGLFLPQVWEQLPDKADFMTNLCFKAGLLPGDWMLEGTTLSKFRVEIIREDEFE